MTKKCYNFEWIVTINNGGNYGLPTIGLHALVQSAVIFRNQGDNLKTIVSKVKEISTRIVVQAAFEDLKYLRMGGRLPFVQAALGTVINLKPIITMKDGVVHAHSKTIGMKRALNYLVRNLEKMLLIIHFLLLLVIRII